LLSSFATKLSQPLFTIVLARILTPKDFGLMALATVLIALADLFQDMGFKQALVQRKQTSPKLLDTVFWGALGLGLVWYAIIFMLAPMAGRLLDNPDIVPILRTLGLLMPISTLGTVPEALLLRELNFKRLWRAELWSALLPGLLSIALALAGHGVWSLVWGAMLGSTARVGTLWTLVSWRPANLPQKGEWKQLVRFGGLVSLESGLVWVINYTGHLLIGRFLGTASLGLYRIGFSLALTPMTSAAQALARVMFPAFSKVQDHPEQLRSGFEKAQRLMALVMFPVGTALAIFADRLVPLLLGPSWEPAAELVKWLALSGVLRASLGTVNGPLYRAVNRVDIMPRFLLVRAAVSVPAYWYAVTQSLTAFAVTHLLLTMVFAPINTAIAVKLFGASPRRVITAVLVPAGLSLAAAMVVWTVALLPLSLIPGLLLQMVCFPLTFWALLYLLCPTQHEELLTTLRLLLR